VGIGVEVRDVVTNDAELIDRASGSPSNVSHRLAGGTEETVWKAVVIAARDRVVHGRREGRAIGAGSYEPVDARVGPAPDPNDDIAGIAVKGIGHSGLRADNRARGVDTEVIRVSDLQGVHRGVCAGAESGDELTVLANELERRATEAAYVSKLGFAGHRVRAAFTGRHGTPVVYAASRLAIAIVEACARTVHAASGQAL
jgi:hypothetical protein